MEIIPVIDIRHGVVVRAVAGRRDHYATIVTPLAQGGAPVDVLRGLLSLHPFKAAYIADLDAIERRGDNHVAIAALAAAFPTLRIWVDAGMRDARDISRQLKNPKIDVVVGAETLADARDLAAFRNEPRLVLSLDFMDATFLGAPEVLENPDRWPARVIVMTLARVGAGLGPDLARLQEIITRADGRRVYAAGGMRGLDDLMLAQHAGAAGALVASALHDGRLTPSEILRLAQ